MPRDPMPARRWLGRPAWMAALTGLFSLRVLGQAIQRWAPRPFLPPFAAFQGSHLPYPVLLGAQLIILGWMIAGCRSAIGGTEALGPRKALALKWFGCLYMGGSLARIVIGLLLPTAAGWFRAWISGFFHLVLAAFVLAVAMQPRGTPIVHHRSLELLR